MKTRKTITLTVVAALMLLLAGGVGLVWAQGAPLGYAFTYQGQLLDDGNPATGSYDFQFDLYDHPSTGTKVGGPINLEDIGVNAGLFTVQLDFGPTAFTGHARFLEIGVRAGDSSGAYTTLAPRQQLTAAPYALHSLSTGALQGHPVSDTLPSTGQLLQWNGSAWQPASAPAANQPPVAVLQADPAVLMPGETTTLDLALSYDPEGGPLTYAFDFMGQTMGPPSTYVVTPTTVVCPGDYPAAGYYMAAGWAKDGAGRFDVARALVEVHGFWPTVVDSAGDVGQHASLAVVDGNPAIAYYENTNNDLMYVRALDTSGLYWGTPVTVTTTGDVGQYASLAVVDGRPAIAYYDAHPNYDLEYVLATDTTGSSWGSPATVDTTGMVGEYASLAVVDGRPAIAYFDSANSWLWYVRASDASGSSWGSRVLAATAVSWWTNCSLGVVDGNPAIAYHDSPNLKYVRASDASGSTWGSPVTVVGGTDLGWYASMEVVDGRPAIAYYDNSNGELEYVRASNASGSTWGTPVTLDSTGDVGQYASLQVVDGRPAIAYYDNTGDDLRYAQATDTTGATWGTPVTVDSDGDVGQYASLAVVDDRAAMAYYDNTNDELDFAIFQ